MSRLLFDLIDIAHDRGCDRIVASLDLRDSNASLTLLAALKFGFIVAFADKGVLIIEKIFCQIDNDLGDKHGID